GRLGPGTALTAPADGAGPDLVLRPVGPTSLRELALGELAGLHPADGEAVARAVDAGLAVLKTGASSGPVPPEACEVLTAPDLRELGAGRCAAPADALVWVEVAEGTVDHGTAREATTVPLGEGDWVLLGEGDRVAGRPSARVGVHSTLALLRAGALAGHLPPAVAGLL
ncbi:hypothetical protein, partial [Streptomyces sp. SID4917]|uniref:hypothetical protein n=1 Tax=Streptomyces sp. SID4917 TaxID=2690269 RepID=UPI001370BF45